MSDSGERDLRIGIDVGGTNTDAAVLGPDNQVLAWTKQPTSVDVTSGMRAALTAVLDQLGDDRRRVRRVMLGTTHATNAILERRSLGRVGVIRIGAPATRSVPPLAGWPSDLVQVVAVGRTIVSGGHLIDGYPIAPLGVEAVKRFLDAVAGTVDSIAVTGVFSPAFPDQEREVAELTAAVLGPERPVSMSHEIGTLGLIERENATVLNAALYGVATEVTGALDNVLRERGFDDLAPFFAQNDGTLMALEYAARYPVLTIGSGPANSIRGAAFLSGLEDAIVVDVGGTSTDLGVLVNGFPRESSAAVDVGGVRTNFRMPDILSVAIGGGTVVGGTPQHPVLGPESVGYRIAEHALCFGGIVPTLTDAAVSAGRAPLGKPPLGEAVSSGLLLAALRMAEQRVSDAVDQVSLGKLALPVVVVGGGAVLLPDSLELVGETIRPQHSGIANAVGAAIALVSGRWDAIVPTGAGHDEAIQHACDIAISRAVEAGAQPGKVEIVELNEVPLSYLPQPSIRVNVKAAGPLGRL
jgi:N-methylhydantoinase A/oxoprolinase/acetone carboxylase beta subunit